MDVRNKNVLVVGNPVNTGFADLPGAAQEASPAEAKFKEFEYQIVPEIDTGSNAIMSSLFANDYRVVHLAGHGVYRYTPRSENEEEKIFTGMVLGNNVFLTANEIGNKMNIPELVFINCCHLGTLDAPAGPDGHEFNKLAASLSQKLIEMGVKAVIAAGWAVDDAAALTFADVFYDHLLKGATFGDAVQEARIETYNLHKDRTNTWAAYQCYGDPAYRLGVLQGGGARAADRFVDVDEAVLEIRRLSGLATTTAAAGIASLREGLLGLEKRIEKDSPDWLKNSILQEALGDAFSEVFLFDMAVENYRLALENDKCAASIKSVEQLANLRIRMAVQAVEKDPTCYEASRAEIQAQIETLESLMKTLGRSAERLSMVGSGYKRLALISCDESPEECDRALQKMEDAYKEAWEKAQNNPYPLTNYLAARVIHLLRTADPEATKIVLPKLVEDAAQAARLADKEKINSPYDFWASVGSTDASLIVYLVDYLSSGPKDLREALFEELASAYITTWQRYGSARELNSVIEQYMFLSAMLKGIKGHKKLSSSIAKILSALDKIAE